MRSKGSANQEPPRLPGREIPIPRDARQIANLPSEGTCPRASSRIVGSGRRAQEELGDAVKDTEVASRGPTTRSSPPPKTQNGHPECMSHLREVEGWQRPPPVHSVNASPGGRRPRDRTSKGGRPTIPLWSPQERVAEISRPGHCARLHHAPLEELEGANPVTQLLILSIEHVRSLRLGPGWEILTKEPPHDRAADP